MVADGSEAGEAMASSAYRGVGTHPAGLNQRRMGRVTKGSPDPA